MPANATPANVDQRGLADQGRRWCARASPATYVDHATPSTATVTFRVGATRRGLDIEPPYRNPDRHPGRPAGSRAAGIAPFPRRVPVPCAREEAILTRSAASSGHRETLSRPLIDMSGLPDAEPHTGKRKSEAGAQARRPARPARQHLWDSSGQRYRRGACVRYAAK